MPRIPTYPLAGSVSNDDLMLIDDVSEIYTTKSLKLSTLKGYVNTGQATTTYVDDRVVSGASFNTSTGVLTLTRTDGIDVTEDLDGRYAVTSSLSEVATSGSYNDLSDTPFIPSGTVTSVGLSMPPAFTLIGSPITSAGVFIVSGAGNSSQYVDGTGSLQTFPTIPTVPANIVETVTTTDGSFIDLTPDTATDGAVTITADLSAQGTPDATTFLRGDNTWAVPPGGGGGGVVQSLTTNGTSGPATLISGVLNIPEYSGSSGGGVVESFQKQLQIIFSPAQLNSFNNNATLELPILAAPGAKKIIIVDEVSTLKYFPSGSFSSETNYTFSADLSVTLKGLAGAVNNAYSGHRVVLDTTYLNSVSTSIGQQIPVTNPYTVTQAQNLSLTTVFWDKPLVLQWHNQQSGTHNVGGSGSWSVVLIINYTILDWSNIL